MPFPLLTSRLIQERIFRTGREWMIQNEEIEKLKQELSTLQHKLKMQKILKVECINMI